jgi:hypothetical protein
VIKAVNYIQCLQDANQIYNLTVSDPNTSKFTHSYFWWRCKMAPSRLLPTHILVAKLDSKLLSEVLTVKGFYTFLWTRNCCPLEKSPKIEKSHWSSSFYSRNLPMYSSPCPEAFLQKKAIFKRMTEWCETSWSYLIPGSGQSSGRCHPTYSNLHKTYNYFLINLAKKGVINKKHPNYGIRYCIYCSIFD